MTKTLAPIIFKKMLLNVICVKSLNSLHISHDKLNFPKEKTICLHQFDTTRLVFELLFS